MYSDTVVILAAGRGTRMKSELPKVMLEVAGKPILGHVIDFWEKQGTRKFVFVLGYKFDIAHDYIEKEIRHLAWDIVIQPEQKGISDAILQVERSTPDRFIVALGDCLNIGYFQYPPNMIQGYGIWQNEYKDTQARGCNVVVVKDEVVSVFEKPPMDYAGVGTYFFDKRVFIYIRHTKPSTLRNEVEIADVMTNMVRDGQSIKAVPFLGQFINCTYPEDIEMATKLMNYQGVT